MGEGSGRGGHIMLRSEGASVGLEDRWGSFWRRRIFLRSLSLMEAIVYTKALSVKHGSHRQGNI